MLKSSEFSPFFQRMLESPEQALRALQNDAGAFENEILSKDGDAHVASAVLPNRSALAFVLFGQDGGALVTERSEWMPAISTQADLLQYVDPRSPDGRLLCIPRADQPPVFGLWAPWSETEKWNLPLGVRQLAEEHRSRTVALFSSSSLAKLSDAAATFGLTPYQQRVVAAVATKGSAKRAAEFLGISHAAAREAVSAAARKMHVSNTAALVRAVMAAAFGILPSTLRNAAIFSDTLGLTERQAHVALLIASGFSREATAQTLGASTAVVRKELQTLYAILGAASAADLARIITEMQALRLFAQSIDNAPGFLDPAIEPSRFSMRSNGRGLINWSDYGPASGKPVLVVHSNWCCRAVPLPLLRALQSRGWRPIAIDRPGFGATDLGSSCPEDPFGQAIEDTVQILDSLKIAAIPIIARCGAQFVHAFAAHCPDRVAQVVLASPTPQARPDGKRQGPVGAFKEAFFRSPKLVEVFFRVISAQFTYERVEQLMRSITRDCPVDAALCDDPQFLRDRFRALRPFACGGYIGGINEEMVISHGGWDFAPIPSRNWVILQGAEDFHNDFAEVADYWQALLPDALIEKVENAGRFMTTSHPELIVRTLEMLDHR